MPARSIGTATISFGLVSIPTKLYTTNESSGDISFNMLHDADGARLRQQYVCTQCNEIVDREHTVKGYEHTKGQYVVLSSDELKALDAVATQAIALEEFVPGAAVAPLYDEKSYYLGPDKGGERAYKLLHDAMLENPWGNEPMPEGDEYAGLDGSQSLGGPPQNQDDLLVTGGLHHPSAPVGETPVGEPTAPLMLSAWATSRNS